MFLLKLFIIYEFLNCFEYLIFYWIIICYTICHITYIWGLSHNININNILQKYHKNNNSVRSTKLY